MVWRTEPTNGRPVAFTVITAGGPAVSTVSSSNSPQLRRESMPLPFQFSRFMAALILKLPFAAETIISFSQLWSQALSRSCMWI